MEEKKNGMTWKVGTKEFIIIVTLIVALVASLGTRASEKEVSVLEQRVVKLEEKFNAICDGQRKMEDMLGDIQDDSKKILERVSNMEGKYSKGAGER